MVNKTKYVKIIRYIYADFEQSGNYVVMAENSNRRKPVYDWYVICVRTYQCGKNCPSNIH